MNKRAAPANHRKGQMILAMLIAVGTIWIVTAFFVFNVRHPWATDMEMWMNVGSVLTFQKVPYEQMRPR